MFCLDLLYKMNVINVSARKNSYAVNPTSSPLRCRVRQSLSKMHALSAKTLEKRKIADKFKGIYEMKKRKRYSNISNKCKR